MVEAWSCSGGQHHASTRTKDDIEKISHVYLDLDHGGTASLEALENSDLVPRPNYVLNTSAEKFQVVWKVEGVTTEGGTGMNAEVDGYRVAGKTGTAQKTEVGRLGYVKGSYVASFAGFIPANDRPDIHGRLIE